MSIERLSNGILCKMSATQEMGITIQQKMVAIDP